MILFVGFSKRECELLEDLAANTDFDMKCFFIDSVCEEDNVVQKRDIGDIYPSLTMLNIAGHPDSWQNWIKNLKADMNLRLLPIVGFGPADDVQSDMFYSLGGTSYIVQPRTRDEFVSVSKTMAGYWLDTVELPATYLN